MYAPVRQVSELPYAVLIYGLAGIGKTKFGIDSEAPVFMGSEQGTGLELVDRIPAPKAWADVVGGFKWLLENKHPHKTLVFDSLDWLEPLVYKEVMRLEGKGKTNIDASHGGFDRGKIASLPIWKEFTDLCQRLRVEKKMAIILIAHADSIKFKDPALQADYVRYTPKLFKQAAAYIIEYVDAVLFGNFQAFEDGDGKVTGQGKPFLFTEHRPGFDAKNRFKLPFQMGRDFSEFHSYVKAEPLPVIAERIKELSEGLPTDRREKLIEALGKSSSDRAKLTSIEKSLKIELEKLKDKP